MSMESNYFIKEGYKPRVDIVPHSAVEGGASYWSSNRKDSSRYYQCSVYARAAAIAASLGQASVADVGCGSGYKLMNILFPVTKDVTGFDQPYIIEYCTREYPAAQWQSLDLDARNDADRKYDVVICADVIEHLEDPDKLLNFIKSASHQDTKILISTPERDVLHGADNLSPTNRDHIREWNQEELCRYLEHSGFAVKKASLVTTLKPHWSKHYLHFLKNNWRRLKHTILIEATLQ